MHLHVSGQLTPESIMSFFVEKIQILQSFDTFVTKSKHNKKTHSQKHLLHINNCVKRRGKWKRAATSAAASEPRLYINNRREKKD